METGQETAPGNRAIPFFHMRPARQATSRPALTGRGMKFVVPVSPIPQVGTRGYGNAALRARGRGLPAVAAPIGALWFSGPWLDEFRVEVHDLFIEELGAWNYRSASGICTHGRTSNPMGGQGHPAVVALAHGSPRHRGLSKSPSNGDPLRGYETLIHSLDVEDDIPTAGRIEVVFDVTDRHRVRAQIASSVSERDRARHWRCFLSRPRERL
jgi:hypothetical protein